MIEKGFTRTKEYTGRNPVLVKGFDRVNGSQRTRWNTQALPRLPYEPLNAIPVNYPSVLYQLTRQPLDLLITS
jgi:hypothetical protein